MKIKKLITISAVITAMGLGVTAQAADLLEVYQQALKSDPTFKKAEADWLTAKENLPLALTGSGAAGSGLFPNVTFTGDLERNYLRQHYNTKARGTYEAADYSVTLTQPIFNVATWKSIASASFSAKAATATYLAAAQDLMQRTAFAYFEVLRANDSLKYVLAQKEQDLHQLDTARQKFKVGLIAITGVYDAQASYDADIASEIGARNNLANQIENLRAITGVDYRRVASLRDHIPLVVPVPNNISRWVQTADDQNYLLKADNFSRLSAHENISEAQAGRYPTVNFVGSYSHNTAGAADSNALQNIIRARQTSASYDLDFNFPLFQGGYVFAHTAQARYQYQSAAQQMEIDHRNVVNQTRQAFLGVQAGISQVKADKQAIVSAKNKLAATRAGYVVGTRTMVDVLDAVTNLTQAQQNYANDRYNYVENIIQLKEQAGILSPHDLVLINRWLGSGVALDTKQPKVKQIHIEYPSVSPDVNPSPKGYVKPNAPSKIKTAPTKINKKTNEKIKHKQQESHQQKEPQKKSVAPPVDMAPLPAPATEKIPAPISDSQH